jgi:hypothetical protein
MRNCPSPRSSDGSYLASRVPAVRRRAPLRQHGPGEAVHPRDRCSRRSTAGSIVAPTSGRAPRRPRGCSRRSTAGCIAAPMSAARSRTGCSRAPAARRLAPLRLGQVVGVVDPAQVVLLPFDGGLIASSIARPRNRTRWPVLPPFNDGLRFLRMVSVSAQGPPLARPRFPGMRRSRRAASRASPVK